MDGLDLMILNHIIEKDDIIKMIEICLSEYKKDKNKESFDNLVDMCGMLVGKREIENHGIVNIIKSYRSHLMNKEIKKIEKKQKQ